MMDRLHALRATAAAVLAWGLCSSCGGGESAPKAASDIEKPSQAAADVPVAGGIGSVPFRSSTMLEQVAKIGIDLKNIPKLSDIPLDQKKRLMPLFKKS